MAWCKDNDVDYVIGLAKNSRLVERIGWELADAAAEAEREGPASPPVRGLPLRHPDELVVPAPRHREGRASDGQVEPRFVVTSLPRTPSRPRTVYERLYCARGNMENTIKEQQLDLFSDRTSATCFAANQLRLLFSAFASILFSAIRQALHGTQLARATAGTLRLKLLKIGARVMVSVRRVKVAMDSATLPPQRSPGSTLDYQGSFPPLLNTCSTPRSQHHCVPKPVKAPSARRSRRQPPRKHPPRAFFSLDTVDHRCYSLNPAF